MEKCCSIPLKGGWLSKAFIVVSVVILVLLGYRLFQGGGDPEFRTLCVKDFGRGAWMKMEPEREGKMLSQETCWGCMADDNNMICDRAEYDAYKARKGSVSTPALGSGVEQIPATPREIVEEYFDAWGRLDWAAMYALISDGFKRIDPNAKDFPSFTQFAEGQNIMGVITKEVQELAHDDTTARVRYSVDFVLQDGATRPFSDSFTLKYRRNDQVPGWKLIHPFGPNVDTSE